MPILSRTLVIGLVAALIVVPAAAAEDGRRVAAKDSAISFTSDLDKALETALVRGLPLYLAFGAAWCPVCREMEATTLLDPPIQALADDFVWVTIDIDRDVTLAREWGVEATPTIFLLDPGGNARLRIVGGTGADELAALLKGFLKDLDEAATAGEPVPAHAFQYSELTVKPGGFRGKSICFSHVGYGPLGIRSQSPFQALRLAILSRTPSTLARGEHQARVGASWVNLWAVDQGVFDPASGVLGPYVFDSEAFDLDVAYGYGLGDTVQIEVAYEHRWRFGGVMDGFVEGFHDLFGIEQSGRDRWPRGQTFILIDPGDGRPPINRDRTSEHSIAQSVRASFQHNVTCGTEYIPALSWSATVRTAVGGEDLEGSNVDFALSAAASRRIGRFYVYLTFGYTWYGSDGFAELDLEDTQLSALVAAEWRFKPRMSLLLQYLLSEGAAVDLGPFSETSHEVVVGWKWEFRPAGVLEIGLIENVITFDNSPDFGLHAAVTQRF